MNERKDCLILLKAPRVQVDDCRFRPYLEDVALWLHSHSHFKWMVWHGVGVWSAKTTPSQQAKGRRNHRLSSWFLPPQVDLEFFAQKWHLESFGLFLAFFRRFLKHWPNHWFQCISNMYARMTPCVTFTKHKIYSCTIGSHTRFAMVWKHVLHSQLEASHLGSPTKRREEIAGESPHVKFGWLLKKLSHVTICDAEPQAAWSLQINKIGQNWHIVKVYTSAAITGSYLELPTSPILNNAKLLYSRPSPLAPTRNISSVAAIPKGHIRKIVSQSHAAENRRWRSAFNQVHLMSIIWDCMRKIEKPCRQGLQEEMVCCVLSQFVHLFGLKSWLPSSQEVQGFFPGCQRPNTIQTPNRVMPKHMSIMI